MKSRYRNLALPLLAAALASPLHAGLIHQYKFNETTGTVAEDAVGTEDGTIGANVVLGQPGQVGTAFKFPATAAGADSRVTLPAAVTPGAVFSMTAFYNLAAPLPNLGQMHIISGNNGAAGRWNLGINDNNGAAAGVDPRLFWFQNGGVAGAPVFSTPIANVADQWVHVGITRDATGKTRLYLNGVGEDIGTSTGTLATTTIGIGERPNFNQFQFNGRIDQVQFYDTALTDQEMATLAAETDDSDHDGLTDDWEMQYFNTLAFDGDDDSVDQDGFNNRIEFAAGTDPTDANSFPQGDSDNDQMDDGYEYLNFGDLSRDGNGDFDADGSLDFEEAQATAGILVVRNPNGSVASTSTFTGSSRADDANSQPNSDGDTLPDGYEYKHFSGLFEDSTGDFDLDGFSNGDEFMANSNPARKANTPDNVHATTRVAVTDNTGIGEYSVTDRVWTFVKTIATTTGGFYGVTGNSDGYLYASTLETPPRIVRVNPALGEIITLATRDTGDAATAGWTASAAQGIEIGPDGKLYFSTAFPGDGVFRLNTDGTGFEQFIAATGGTAPDDWSLSNSRDLEWSGNTLYVSARGGFGAINRPVYSFDSNGTFQNLISGSLTAPQGLEFAENGLLVTSTNAGTITLSLIDLTGPFPAAPSSRSDSATQPGLDVIDLNGDVYTVTYQTGPGATVGQILRNGTEAPFSSTVVVNALPDRGNDLAIFTSSLVGDPYSTWATANGLDPNSPEGARSGDFDGDGTTNEVEFALALDPKDGTARFAVTTTGTTSAGQTLTWPSQPGIEFEVRSSTDLMDWTTLEATVTGQAELDTASFAVPAATGPRKFYRVQFQP